MNIDRRFNIVELFVNDIEVYLQSPPTSTHSLYMNVYIRVHMLNLLMQYSELRITYDQLLRLWESVRNKGAIAK